MNNVILLTVTICPALKVRTLKLLQYAVFVFLLLISPTRCQSGFSPFFGSFLGLGFGFF